MRFILTRYLTLAVLAAAALAAGSASAQNNSLYAGGPKVPPPVNSSLAAPQQQLPQQPGMSLADTSWTYMTPMEPRKMFEVNDIVRVAVKVNSTMTSTGKIDRKKTGYSDWKLTNWIKFYPGVNLGENGGQSGQPPYGTPEVRGDLDSKLNAQGNLQTQDSMTFTISCRVVDKRPNGNLVLEGTWSVSDNEEKWEYSLAGECRPEDVKPDNSVISDTITDLKVIRKESGSVRDSYRRGWALQWLDKWQPF
jgi:flagellar L-ring protein precursor FlgH